MIKLIKQKQNCYGCGACESICPKQAISMYADDEGFLYPFIDNTLCVECGMCISVCPVQHEINIEKLDVPLVFALKHKDDSVRMSSSSGGAYTAISDYILANAGRGGILSVNNSIRYTPNLNDNINTYSSGYIKTVCYGVAFDKDFTVHHKAATTTAERDQFRGSKYVQSNLGSTFIEAKKNLIEGKTVLFTGTPCQTAGLSKFLEVSKIDTTNLILNDIICTGVPSPKLWNEYVEFLEVKYKSKLKSFTFRAKEAGWKGYSVRAEFENGNIKTDTVNLRIFTKLFFTHLVLRPSCYYCKFSNLKRPADITIADFWGIDESLPEFEDEKGVSLVLINTPKGKAVFEKLQNSSYCEQSNIIACSKHQHSLNRPTQRPDNRDIFWQDYYGKGFYYIANKYGGCGFIGRAKSFAVKALRRLKLLSVVKKVLRKQADS